MDCFLYKLKEKIQIKYFWIIFQFLIGIFWVIFFKYSALLIDCWSWFKIYINILKEIPNN